MERDSCGVPTLLARAPLSWAGQMPTHVALVVTLHIAASARGEGDGNAHLAVYEDRDRLLLPLRVGVPGEEEKSCPTIQECLSKPPKPNLAENLDEELLMKKKQEKSDASLEGVGG